MKKFIINSIILSIICLAVGILVNYWIIYYIVPFLYLLFIKEKPQKSYFMGFISSGVVWIALSLFFSYKSNFLLAEKIIELFKLNNMFFLFGLTFILGGIVGGIGSLSGSIVKSFFTSKQ